MKLRSFFVVVALLSSTTIVKAQQLSPIPADKDVRVGKLSNGLTYYIRHNEYPKNVANFYIAQRVGSIQENDDQRGLAHFLEHMAFNGSKHFPGNGIIDFTRSLGVEFGSNLNAYTSIDQTVYRICDVPTNRQSALDSCLLVLRDWSGNLTLDAKEIDKERGVVHQEWQMGASAGQRFYENYLPQLYPGSKYGNRLPIGLMSIVDNFKPKVLRQYYRKWYRPDNQAIIVVGNIDVDHVEAEIKALWADAKVPAHAAQVVDEQVPDNNKPIYVTFKDKEQAYTVIQMMHKHDVYPDSLKSNMMYMINGYIKSIMTNMLNARYQEMAQDSLCPFVGASVSDGNYIISKTKDAFSGGVVPKDGQVKEAIKALVREMERARQFGFTETELARVKSSIISAAESMYANREMTPNTTFYNQYVSNYLENEPMPSIEDQYRLTSSIIPQLTVEMINDMAKQLIVDTDTNLVVIAQEQEKEGKTDYITVDLLKNAIKEARSEKLTAWVDHVKQEPLIAELPAKGEIVKETENKKLGFKKWTLSNGVTVILKKTDFQNEQVKMNAIAKGGTNRYGEKDFINNHLFNQVIGYSGIGNFTSTELSKVLAGKRANADLGMSLYNTTVSGSSTPKDMETMMQMAYLYFTKIKKDEKSFKMMMNAVEMELKNKNLKPEEVYDDSVSVTRFVHNPRFAPLELKDLAKVDYDRILEMAKEVTADASKFTFYFTGNFDEEKLREYVKQYVASLPANKNAKASSDTDPRTLAVGMVKNHFERKMDTPKAQLTAFWTSKPLAYTLENDILVDALGKVLDMALLRSIREESSAAYSVGAQGFVDSDINNKATYTLYAGCPMDPAKAQLAYDLMMKGVSEATVKIDAADVQKAKEFMLKQFDENARNNNYWLDVLYNYNRWGVDSYTNYKDIVKSLTPEKLSAFLKNVILSSGNKMEVMMTPAQ